MRYLNILKQLLYYFIKLPLFSIKLFLGKFSTLAACAESCPESHKIENYRTVIKALCKTYPFLSEQYPEKLCKLYNLTVSIIKADIFTYPFLNKRIVAVSNEFHNLEALSEAYEKGPVLILYAHTGSFFQVIAATGVLGYKVYPIADGSDISTLEIPFRWVFQLNRKLSEPHFSGGHYMYTNTPSLYSLREILSQREKAIIYAAIDLPMSSITDKRISVRFLDGETAFPYKIVEIYLKQDLPIFIALPYLDIINKRIKRVVHFERVPENMQTDAILQLYATKLGNFIKERPEQLFTLITLKELFK